MPLSRLEITTENLVVSGGLLCGAIPVEYSCGRQAGEVVQFGHGRILGFLDHEDPSLRLDRNPVPSGEPGKEEAFISCISTLKETHSTQRPTKGVIMRSDRIRKAAGKDKGYLALNEVNDDSQ